MPSPLWSVLAPMGTRSLAVGLPHLATSSLLPAKIATCHHSLPTANDFFHQRHGAYFINPHLSLEETAPEGRAGSWCDVLFRLRLCQGCLQRDGLWSMLGGADHCQPSRDATAGFVHRDTSWKVACVVFVRPEGCHSGDDEVWRERRGW